MLTSMRSDLRKCRSQLACQVSSRAALAREHRTLQEENQRLITHQSLSNAESTRLTQEFIEMKNVASKTQQRLENLKGRTPEATSFEPSAVHSLSNFKLNLTEDLSFKIGQAKATLSALEINDSERMELNNRQEQLSQLLQELHGQEIGQEAAMNESRQAFQQFGYPPISYQDCKPQQVTPPQGRTQPCDIISFSNAAMHAFQAALS